ncbi:P-loop containing nucleoside triphosphate hydrolase protein [Gorgonomyces haynaldii]|nr:P-loop containing nucleoside triphosphate hydrolase protein [Gorgonomyces haynaldii]
MILTKSQENSYFVDLPPELTQILYDRRETSNPQHVVVKLNDVYLNWSGKTCEPDCIQINALVAETLGVQNQVKPQFVNARDLPVANQVFLEPKTEQDWQVLELNSGLMEATFYNQVRVIHAKQEIIVWVGNHPVHLKIQKTVPSQSLVTLAPDAELIVEPKVKKQPKHLIRRVIPDTWMKLNVGDCIGSPDFPEKTWVHVQSLDYDHISQGNQIHGFYQTTKIDKSCILSVKQMTRMSCVPQSKILVETLDPESECVPESITLLTTQPNAKQMFLEWIKDQKILFDGMRIPDLQVTLQFVVKKQSTGQPLYCHVNERLESVKVQERKTEFSLMERYWTKPELRIGYSQLEQQSQEFLQQALLLKQQKHPSGALLIHGNPGCGKSSLLNHLEHQLCLDGVFVSRTQCSELKNLSQQQWAARLDNDLYRALWQSPSVLIYDDLDALIQRDQENQISFRSKHFAHSFAKTVQQLLNAQVLVICSAMDASQLHPILQSTHLFFKTIKISLPDKQQRLQLLEHFAGNLNLDDIVLKMDGYAVSDIKQLHKRAIQQGLQRNSKISEQDFYKVLESFKPLSLMNVQLHESKTKWADIGGMTEAKEMIVQTLKWPTMYPQIYQSFTLRLRSGILLYGYPGCGKTMLASASAAYCGLNFISVKGPELLNKYIGASEKAVRDLFERAKQAKPCCLFFDEFDSIAPRRGQDNTGVTDRVVNQLLTEMDGAQGLQGVFVLAATSRPDMIDPALLRPGRLDKKIFCALPTVSERLDIIQKISQKIPLSPDLDLQQLATQTEGYTGADMQGVLYNAQLLSIHESMQSVEITQSDSQVQRVCTKQKNQSEQKR